jgi:hypothetical protein
VQEREEERQMKKGKMGEGVLFVGVIFLLVDFF